MTAVQLRMERFPKGRNYPHGSKGRVKPVHNFHKKYLGNTAEGQGFADKTKKKAFYQYKKLQAKEHAKSKCAKPVTYVKTTENVKKKKVDAFKQAEKQFQKRKHEKEIQHKIVSKHRVRNAPFVDF
ncbi:uncharacterized protein LOC106176478 isoform X2 [Lingula anatina]|uniref:Uncharacterized protein LOC106176478 isoform X2 n=1 Tax=Lingula anatina TaxID=7574 RepID=A0A1S3JVA4_LINAN|nr:uncharacterized protein LOC106176478 isoform X2 [Lingula anatina]|eukprot:XP_013414335.1 uncharacterized protein LOC106176478 isoform X2 [Lingula anatina]